MAEHTQHTQHTPGPWIVVPDQGTVCPECGEEYGESLMVAWRPKHGCSVVGLAVVLADDREQANARLIAAAPCLLEAAGKVLAGLNARIDAAIAAGGPIPVFDGVAELHAAVAQATKGA